MDIKQIGANILFYLKEQNKTQVDLANGLGASKQVVNKIIKRKKAIKTDELVAISNFLGVSVEELINTEKPVIEEELEAVHLYGEIENKETADFILALVRNLSTMEEELDAHGLQKTPEDFDIEDNSFELYEFLCRASERSEVGDYHVEEG